MHRVTLLTALAAGVAVLACAESVPAAIIAFAFENQTAIRTPNSLDPSTSASLDALGVTAPGAASGSVTIDTSVLPASAGGLDVFVGAVVSIEVMFGDLSLQSDGPGTLVRSLRPAGAPESLLFVARPGEFTETPAGSVDPLTFSVVLTELGGEVLPPGALLDDLLSSRNFLISADVIKIIDGTSDPVILETPPVSARRIPEPRALWIALVALSSLIRIGGRCTPSARSTP